jgi:hypothetical protein
VLAGVVIAQVLAVPDARAQDEVPMHFHQINVRSDFDGGGREFTDFQPGYALRVLPDITIEYRWTEPPKCFSEKGFDVEVEVRAVAGPTARIAAGTRAGADGGFTVTPTDGLASVNLEPDKSARVTQKVTFVPHHVFNVGNRLEVWIGVQWYDYYYFTYESRRERC